MARIFLQLNLEAVKGKKKKRKWSCSDVSDSLRPHGPQPTRLLRPWDFSGKNTGVGCHCPLQEIFLTQGLNLRGLLHCRQTLYRLSHQGSPWKGTVYDKKGPVGKKTINQNEMFKVLTRDLQTNVFYTTQYWTL